jgi:hypothetical protein
VSNTRVATGPGFRVCFDDAPGYLRAYVFDGTDSLAVSLAMWRMVAAECQRVAAQRLLVLEDLHATVAEPDLEQLVEAICGSGLVGVRLAFVELREDLEGNEMAEIMCRERGMAVRVFAHEDDARRWLVYGD